MLLPAAALPVADGDRHEVPLPGRVPSQLKISPGAPVPAANSDAVFRKSGISRALTTLNECTGALQLNEYETPKSVVRSFSASLLALPHLPAQELVVADAPAGMARSATAAARPANRVMRTGVFQSFLNSSLRGWLVVAILSGARSALCEQAVTDL